VQSSYSVDSVLSSKPPPRLRAFVEIVDGQVMIFPIADSDEDERRIRDALRFLREGVGER